ncbi:alpha-xenorhabdolysin family binary toxin subunit A [Aeromonas hydrophila]|uniref:alpha-xenorhabdolysin family binary toxin subunit A n=1 Tax=Aeromonas hydrophila TaxID=644 RepID=UPI001934623E|nr:alpha-xenorhabdolysin family binary toxin subunit A [Aeromonas hydrophila]MBW3771023.1 alpha-xenorhabdolysin family binary toxin subunit A [Aeromonas hydrophila]
MTLKLLTGSETEGGRAAGIFTADDLIKILLYVRAARKLPQNLADFTKDIGSDSTGIPGLEPNEIIDLYQKITNHANRWTPVESLVKEQAASLKVASNDIVTIGDQIIKVINQMDIMEQLKTIKDPTVTIPISSDKDTKIQQALPEVIEKLKQSCIEQQRKTLEVLKAVRDYKTEISGGTLSSGKTVMGLEPTLADKKERAKKANLDGQIKELQDSIDALQDQIDQLKKDYDKYVGLAFTGAAGGIIGLAITGGIFGDKAEKARKERNSKIQEKDDKSKDLKRKQQVQGILNQFSTQFTDIGMRLLDAEQSLEHLDFLWTDIIVRINKSVDNWMKVKDSDMLLSFVTDLEVIVKPWREVGDMSTELVRVFDKAYEEFKKTYGS